MPLTSLHTRILSLTHTHTHTRGGKNVFAKKALMMDAAACVSPASHTHLKFTKLSMTSFVHLKRLKVYQSRRRVHRSRGVGSQDGGARRCEMTQTSWMMHPRVTGKGKKEFRCQSFCSRDEGSGIAKVRFRGREEEGERQGHTTSWRMRSEQRVRRVFFCNCW